MSRETFFEVAKRCENEAGFMLYGHSVNWDDMEELRAACLILARLLRRSQAELAPC